MKNLIAKLAIMMLILNGSTLMAMDKPLPEKSKGILSKVKDALSSKPTSDQATQKLRSLIDSDKKVTRKEIESLLVAGADTEVKSDKNRTILEKAVRDNNSAFVTLLLEKGADANVDALLVVAANNKNNEIVKQLIKAGANVNKKDAQGFSPLYYAAYEKNVDMVRTLVSNGADVNSKTAVGNTPLHVVLAKSSDTGSKRNKDTSDAEIIKILLDNGADITITNQGRKTPFDLAKGTEHETMVRLMADLQAKKQSKK